MALVGRGPRLASRDNLGPVRHDRFVGPDDADLRRSDETDPHPVVLAGVRARAALPDPSSTKRRERLSTIFVARLA